MQDIYKAMQPGTDHIGVGVGVTLLNDKGELFLAKRSHECKNEKGYWETPGGALHQNETLEGCLHRELQEEYGIEVDIIEQWPAYDHMPDGQHWVAITFEARLKPGHEPVINEPHKCDEIGWFSLDDLPEPLALTAQHDIATLRSRQQSLK